MVEHIQIGSIDVEVIKKNIKNMHLAVYPPDGRVRLAVPDEINDETIRLFTISKLSWIKRQQRKFADQDRQSPRNYIQRESHYFLGKRYLLRIIEEDKPARVTITNRAYIDLHVRPNTSKEQREGILNEWYRAELKKIIPSIMDKWERKLGVYTEDWGVKQMKTKWGTCNIEAKRIWLNLELAKKPIHCLEYIIVHELIHLIERHHNENFLAHMDKYLPKWKQYKIELNSLPVSHGDWGY